MPFGYCRLRQRLLVCVCGNLVVCIGLGFLLYDLITRVPAKQWSGWKCSQDCQAAAETCHSIQIGCISGHWLQSGPSHELPGRNFTSNHQCTVDAIFAAHTRKATASHSRQELKSTSNQCHLFIYFSPDLLVSRTLSLWFYESTRLWNREHFHLFIFCGRGAYGHNNSCFYYRNDSQWIQSLWILKLHHHSKMKLYCSIKKLGHLLNIVGKNKNHNHKSGLYLKSDVLEIFTSACWEMMKQPEGLLQLPHEIQR